MDTATAARPRVTPRDGTRAERRRPVARDNGLIALLALLVALGLLFWSAVIAGLVALL